MHINDKLLTMKIWISGKKSKAVTVRQRYFLEIANNPTKHGRIWEEELKRNLGFSIYISQTPVLTLFYIV